MRIQLNPDSMACSLIKSHLSSCNLQAQNSNTIIPEYYSTQIDTSMHGGKTINMQSVIYDYKKKWLLGLYTVWEETCINIATFACEVNQHTFVDNRSNLCNTPISCPVEI